MCCCKHSKIFLIKVSFFVRITFKVFHFDTEYPNNNNKQTKTQKKANKKHNENNHNMKNINNSKNTNHIIKEKHEEPTKQPKTKNANKF